MMFFSSDFFSLLSLLPLSAAYVSDPNNKSKFEADVVRPPHTQIPLSLERITLSSYALSVVIPCSTSRCLRRFQVLSIRVQCHWYLWAFLRGRRLYPSLSSLLTF